MARTTLTRDFYIPTASTKITDKKSSAVAYIYTSRSGKPAAALFYGKAAKPVSHYSYGTPAHREAAIVRFFESSRATEQRKAEYKAERAKPHTLEVGHVLSSSYGYDQTNVNFYVVTKIIGAKMVEVTPCASMVVEDQGDRGRVIPNSDRLTGQPMRRKADCEGRVTIDNVRYARLWNGQPMYFSSYA